VQRVLGRQRGIRIGEEPDRDGQYFHYLAMWRGVPLNTSREPRCCRRAVACCTPGCVRHACRIQILSSRIRLASRATALRRGHERY
jgi:hypothetical protein